MLSGIFHGFRRFFIDFQRFRRFSVIFRADDTHIHGNIGPGRSRSALYQSGRPHSAPKSPIGFSRPLSALSALSPYQLLSAPISACRPLSAPFGPNAPIGPLPISALLALSVPISFHCLLPAPIGPSRRLSPLSAPSAPVGPCRPLSALSAHIGPCRPRQRRFELLFGPYETRQVSKRS